VSLRFPGNAIFRPETRAPKRPLKAKCLIPETKRPEYKAAKRGHFAILQEIPFAWECVVGLRGLELPTKRLSAASFGGNPDIPRKSRDVRCWPVLRVVNFGQTHSPSVGTIQTPKNRAMFGSGRSQTRSKRPKTRFWLWHENSAKSANSDRRQKW